MEVSRLCLFVLQMDSCESGKSVLSVKLKAWQKLYLTCLFVVRVPETPFITSLDDDVVNLHNVYINTFCLTHADTPWYF